MEKRQKRSALDFIQNELENFQRLCLEQKESDSSSECVGRCGAKILIEKLIAAVQNEEKVVLAETEAAGTTTSPEQKAMGNSVVLRKILSFMNSRSLLGLRGVCKVWRDEVTSLLVSPRRNQELCIQFNYSSEDKEFRKQKGYPLTVFMEDGLQHSTVFPCSKFRFLKGALHDPSLILFFSEYGRHVQDLMLQPESLEVETLENLLFKWTPNLKSLKIQPMKWPRKKNLNLTSSDSKISGTQNQTESQSQSQLEPQHQHQGQRPLLPKLTNISLPLALSKSRQHGGEFFYQVLTSAPNLTSIEDPYLAYIPEIILAGKLPLIQSLTWNFGNRKDLEDNFIRFATAGCQLKSLNVEDSPMVILEQKLLEALHSLLQSSQHTLASFVGIQILAASHQPHQLQLQFDLPPLSKVNQIQVNTKRGPTLTPTSAILPPGHTLSKILPNLKTMVVMADDDDDQSNTDYPFNSPLNAHEALSKVQISNRTSEHVFGGPFSPKWLEVMAGLYPNLVHLDLVMSRKGMAHVLESLTIVPQFLPKLEQLSIDVWISPSDCENDSGGGELQAKMDQTLTGFSGEVWQRLLHIRKPDAEFQDLQVLDRVRVRPSIFDLKSLTSLKFEMRYETAAKPLWSHVTEFYAFEPMRMRQGLKVKVSGTQWTIAPLKTSDFTPL